MKVNKEPGKDSSRVYKLLRLASPPTPPCESLSRSVGSSATPIAAEASRRRPRASAGRSLCVSRGRVRVQPLKSVMGLEGGEAAPLSWSANISRFELVEKWGLTPVLKPRQDPRPPEGARYENQRPLPLYALLTDAAPSTHTLSIQFRT